MSKKSDQNNVIKVYVGTDPRMHKAEIALEYSIYKHTKAKVEIEWMDFNRGGLWSDWNIGREHGHPYSGQGWATDFSCFRFAIPEANNFEGRAIYLDADMILLGDIQELFGTLMARPVLITPKGFDVVLFDCAAFKDKLWWPSIEEMKQSQASVSDYGKLLADRGVLGELPADWDCCDGIGYNPATTRLVHYTDMRTQPWKPYPDVFEYPQHPRPDMVALWQKYYDEGVGYFKQHPRLSVKDQS